MKLARVLLFLLTIVLACVMVWAATVKGADALTIISLYLTGAAVGAAGMSFITTRWE